MRQSLSGLRSASKRRVRLGAEFRKVTGEVQLFDMESLSTPGQDLAFGGGHGAPAEEGRCC